MTLSATQFEKCLMLYGTDINQWPQSLQAKAKAADASPALNSLTMQQQYVDEMLLGAYTIEPMSDNFTYRVLRSARSLSSIRELSLLDWLATLFSDFRLPQPAYVIATVIVLGISVGMTEPGPSANSFVAQITFSDDGATL